MFIQMGLASDCRCESAACLVSEGGADGKYGQEGDPGQKNEFFSIWISGFIVLFWMMMTLLCVFADAGDFRTSTRECARKCWRGRS